MGEGRLHLVVVDGDRAGRSHLAGYFRKNGFRVSEASDGLQMQRLIAREPVDLVLLDVDLPGRDGIELARGLRERTNIGVIFVTDRESDFDCVAGLEAGADDYVTKPFEPRVLLARVKSVLRRRNGNGGGTMTRRFSSGWTCDVLARTVHAPDGQNIRLSASEFSLLCVFLDNPNIVLTRERLLVAINHGGMGVSERSIDTLVSRLRRRLSPHRSGQEMIETHHGHGYRFLSVP